MCEVRINWVNFVFGALIVCIGLVCMFTPVWETTYIAGYPVNIPSYPYFGLGVILDFVGSLLILVSFFTGEDY